MATAIDASADGRWVVAACEDKTAQLWDLASADAAPAHVFVVGGRYHSARFSPDGPLLALSWDAGAKVVDVKTGADRYVLPNHGHRAVVRIEWSPDGHECQQSSPTTTRCASSARRTACSCGRAAVPRARSWGSPGVPTARS